MVAVMLKQDRTSDTTPGVGGSAVAMTPCASSDACLVSNDAYELLFSGCSASNHESNTQGFLGQGPPTSCHTWTSVPSDDQAPGMSKLFHSWSHPAWLPCITNPRSVAVTLCPHYLHSLVPVHAVMRDCSQVALDDELAPGERGTDGGLDEEVRQVTLRRVAKAARKQGLYALSARKYTQARSFNTLPPRACVNNCAQCMRGLCPGTGMMPALPCSIWCLPRCPRPPGPMPGGFLQCFAANACIAVASREPGCVDFLRLL